MKDSNPARNEALDANIYVHSQLANTGEYNKSPHFRPENQAKVRAILERLLGNSQVAKEAKAIDFGCGTGFIIHLIRDLVQEVHGVDITVDMMKQVDLSSGNVFLHESIAEHTPFPDAVFDFATAYSFMDHLYSYEDFLREVYRVLKPGGRFYSDLNPNRDFILGIAHAEAIDDHRPITSETVIREIKGALHNGEYYQSNFGIDGALLEKAEPIKSIAKGFDPEEVLRVAREIGFSDCVVEYEWFLGQAKVMHQQSLDEARLIEEYLNSIAPVSSPLFKYLRFVFIK
ncbi:MAG TPA: methyltransferase domain-containing protein [Burkholderiaceae bacterium]|jgi:SAM-dependent methyltransferase|nr:methyltransferase domain-containing protein [Burkholderiaceae bacterium]